MNIDPKYGLSRAGLDADYEREEQRASKLIFEARFILDTLDRNQQKVAQKNYAQAAEIEERLADYCAKKGLTQRYFVEQFRATDCWARAGNLYRASELCDEMLARDDLTDRLREHLQKYSEALQSRLARLNEMASEPVSSET